MIGSLCTGTGALDMAVQAVLGGSLAWVADCDPGAAAILAHRHPVVPNLGDITTVRWPDVPRVDVLTAGFPCQPVSNAGLRLGDQDDRWIWPAVAHAVRDLRPGLVYLENVAALTVRGLGVVVADLAAIGYVGSWRCIRASDIGACHRRERAFIAAWPADAPRPGLETRREGRHRGSAVADAAHLGHERAGEARGRRAGPADPGSLEPDCSTCGCPESFHDAGGFCASCHGCADPELGRPDDAAAHADGSGRRAAVDHLQPGQSDTDRRPTADTDGDGREVIQRGEPGMGPRRDADRRGPVDWGHYAPAIARWERTLGRSAPAPTEPTGRNGAHRLSPRFVEWMQGLPPGWVTGVPGLKRNDQLRALGNGVVPQQAAAALRLLLARTAARSEAAA